MSSIKQEIAIIVAIAKHNAIGVGGDLPWHLPADLRRFKQLTMGHSMIMGRKTYESIGKLLPGRTTVIVTKQTDFSVPGATVVHSLEAAFQAVAGDDNPFIVGGGEIYRQALPHVDKIYLTQVDAELDADTFFPEIEWTEWELIETEKKVPDAKNSFPYVFEVYQKRNPPTSI